MAERERLLVAEDDPPLRLAALALGAPLDARMQGVLGRYFLDAPDASLARLRQMATDAGLAGDVEPSLAEAGDLASQLAGVHYLLVESAEITEEVLARGSALKLVQKHGEDIRNIDVAAAARRLVPVATHLRWANTAVAEHTIALLLAVTRRLLDAHAAAIRPTSDATRGDASYNWPRVEGLRSLRGLTLGLVGLGEIGRDVARKAAAFRMPVVYTQRRRLGSALEVTFGAEFLSLPELLEVSDVVSLHVPLTAETRGMIGARELARMRRGAVLINTSRGALVDEEALLAALREGRPGGAGLDVRAEEPPADAAGFEELPGVVLSPHVAAGTGAELMRDVRDVLANVARVRRGEKPLGLVHS